MNPFRLCPSIICYLDTNEAELDTLVLGFNPMSASPQTGHL